MRSILLATGLDRYDFGFDSNLRPIVLAEDARGYSNRIASQCKNEETILLLSELILRRENERTDLLGIEVLKWLRLKHKLTNPIVLIGFMPLSRILQKHPEHIIITAPGVIYAALPEAINQIQGFVYKLKPVENLIQQYKDFVETDFKIRQFRHSFANSYGFQLMEKIHKYYNDQYETVGVPQTNHLEFVKADFLFKTSAGKENQKDRVKRLRKELTKKLEGKQIVHIDDEGTNRWYHLFESILSPSNYRSISTRSYKDYCGTERERLNKEIFKQGVAPDLILIDLRLLGSVELNKPITECSGARIIRSIRKKDPIVPVILVSATDTIKSLEILQEYPYNVDIVWGKPRVDRNTINLHSNYAELLSKIIQSLDLVLKLKDRIRRKCDYLIRHAKDKENLPSIYADADLVFFDTTSLLKGQSYYKIQVLMHKIAEMADKKRLCIPNDVWIELLVKSKERKHHSAHASDALSRLFLLNQVNKIRFTYSLMRSVIEMDISAGSVPNKEDHTLRDIFLSQQLPKYKGLTTAEANDIIIKTEDYIKRGKLKTLIHADDQFRLLFRHYAQSKRKRQIVFLNDDKKLKKEIVKELFSIDANLSIRRTDVKDRWAEIERFTNLQGIVNAKVFSSDIQIKAGQIRLLILRP